MGFEPEPLASLGLDLIVPLPYAGSSKHESRPAFTFHDDQRLWKPHRHLDHGLNIQVHQQPGNCFGL